MIPTYNQAAFIREAIDSALAQTYPHLEVVVGDDCSSDATAAIVAQVRDPRLKYVRHPANLGRVGNYRSLLYQHASGDYVVNLDGDDYYTDPDFIANAVALISSAPNVVMVAARTITKTGEQGVASPIPDRDCLTGVQILKRLPDLRFFVMHMAVLYARKPAMEIGFYRSPAISSDWESLYRLALRGTVKYLDRKVGVWRIHGANETGTTDLAKQLENLAIWPSIYNDAAQQGMNPLLAKFMSAKCVAYFLQSNLVNVSRTGNTALIRFLGEVWGSYTTAAILVFLTPQYAVRLALCLAGYYRRKTTP